MSRYRKIFGRCIPLLAVAVFTVLSASPALSAPVPGGTLDPATIPKYVTPLVIPPEMPKSVGSPAPAADYDIAVRQFKQQILPGGIWGSTFPNPSGVGTIGPFPATTVWSYGRAADPLPDSSAIGGAAGVAPAQNSTFNYPAFTVENSTAVTTSVRWINDLVDPISGNYLPHLFPVDQTLSWANPPKANCTMGAPNRTDCETMVPDPYTGPVPLVTHVHGSHVQPDSDGYPEAWWLPGAPGTKGIPASFGERGINFTQANNANTVAGSAYYSYQNTQPASTLWYHDHALGMTRLNVYAGPAGFWLVRGGANDTAPGVLPGPAPSIAGGDPNFNAATRANIREIPIAIQDRSFNADGSLFYPASRSFFDTFTGPYIGTILPGEFSDISGIWNPEAFFNTMVVNGTTWPKLDVAPARYRLRLLDGCNSRTLNLSMFVITGPGPDGVFGTVDDVKGAEVPFYQIGGDQGFLPNVVRIETGLITTLPGNGTIPAAVPAPHPSQALLLGPAERADVIVDFSGMANGTRVRIFNTAPDGPFGGFPDVPADPLTSGQVMDFIVNTALTKAGDATTTLPQDLVLPAEGPLGVETNTRMVSLNELMSDQVCVEIDATTGVITTLFTRPPADPAFLADCLATAPLTPGNLVEPMGPRLAVLGVITIDPITGNLLSQAKKMGDAITEFPQLNSIEIWEIYNTTVDAHPIHLHLVRYEVINRQNLDPVTLLPVPGTVTAAQPNEAGYKDTVVALPGQVTRIKARFDIAGLYVWHCHIVEHEDNEMMRPFIVTDPATGVVITPSSPTPHTQGTSVVFTAAGLGSGSANYDYRFWFYNGTSWTMVQDYGGGATWTMPAATIVGNYVISVDVRTNPAVYRDAVAYLGYVVYSGAATGVTITPGSPNPHTQGTSVVFTAAGQGSTNYDYRFLLFNGTSWSVVQNYGGGATWTMPASTPVGNYVVSVDVRTSSAVDRDAVAYLSYEVTSGPATGVTITAGSPNPHTQGTSVVFTAAGQGSANYDYRFLLFNGTSWSIVQNYGGGATWTMPASTPVGKYVVSVDVRTSSAVNRDAVAYLSYEVTSGPATGVTITPGSPTPHLQGTSVVFTAAGQGSANYDYRFLLFNGTSWSIVQNYGRGGYVDYASLNSTRQICRQR